MTTLDKESLLSWLGKTKTAARRVMSAYLKTMPMDVYMQDPKLQALCQFHPTRKFPVSVEMRFVLSARPPYNTKSLFFEARTGGLMDRRGCGASRTCTAATPRRRISGRTRWRR